MEEHASLLSMWLQKTLHTTPAESPWVHDMFLMTGLVMLSTLVLGVVVRSRLSLDKPGVLQQILEMWVQFVQDLLDGVVGHGGRKWLPMIAMFSMFILLSNLLGMVPGFMPPSQYIVVTLSLGITSFLTYHIIGIKETGRHYLAHFTGPILLLAPLFIPIELVSHSARPVSLAVRLFGNIAGEHTAAGVFMTLCPAVVPALLMSLGLLGAVVQTFIFTMLSTVYIGMAVEHH